LKWVEVIEVGSEELEETQNTKRQTLQIPNFSNLKHLYTVSYSTFRGLGGRGGINILAPIILPKVAKAAINSASNPNFGNWVTTCSFIPTSTPSKNKSSQISVRIIAFINLNFFLRNKKPVSMPAIIKSMTINMGLYFLSSNLTTENLSFFICKDNLSVWRCRVFNLINSILSNLSIYLLSFSLLISAKFWVILRHETKKLNL